MKKRLFKISTLRLSIIIISSKIGVNNSSSFTSLYIDNLYSRSFNLSRELASAYPLWIAEYGVSVPTSTGNWDEWIGFQYLIEQSHSQLSHND